MRKTLMAGVAIVAALSAGAAAPAGASRAAGIAARYAADRGIAKDADVVFADDFESWPSGEKPPDGTWGIRQRKTSRTSVVPGTVALDRGPAPGRKVLEIACWTEGTGSQSGGLNRKLGNYNHAREGLGEGFDELYIRYYMKFDEDYRAVRNHGANLGGRDVTRANAAWVGMAAIRDVSSRGYFFSGVQPRGKQGSSQLEMGFYSYHLDKKSQWGENYPVRKPVPIGVGKWYCIERHMKLNSVDPAKADPAVADGVEELWIDGELTIRKEGVRFRRVPQLRITFFSLETYYHGLPKQYTRDRPIKVYVDNVVIARKYIGPLRSETRITGYSDLWTNFARSPAAANIAATFFIAAASPPWIVSGRGASIPRTSGTSQTLRTFRNCGASSSMWPIGGSLMIAPATSGSHRAA
ncbi:MAG: hypothetical protein WBF17_16255 [Phycisphaerae bacterium]